MDPNPPTTPTPEATGAPPVDRVADIARWNQRGPETPSTTEAPTGSSNPQSADVVRAWRNIAPENAAASTPPPINFVPLSPEATNESPSTVEDPVVVATTSPISGTTTPVTVSLRPAAPPSSDPGEMRNAAGESIGEVKARMAAEEAKRFDDAERAGNLKMIRDAKARYPANSVAWTDLRSELLAVGPVAMITKIKSGLDELSAWYKSRGNLGDHVRAQACAQVLDRTIIELARAESLEFQ